MKWTLGLLALAPAFALAQTAVLTTTQQEEVVRAVSSALVSQYLYEDQAQRLAQTLDRGLAQNTFEKAKAPEDFAAAIEGLLRAETRDIHLLVWHGSLGDILKRSPNLTGPSIGRVEVLDGGIGYVEVRNFLGPGEGNAKSAEQIDNAMATVRDASAFIFDLRRNPGGSNAAAAHLATYLFAQRMHLLSSLARGKTAPVDTWTRDEVAGPRHPDAPVFVLTSKLTFSAGETFAFALKQAGRATIVGETTGGGGHSGTFARLPHGFSMFLSTARLFDPRTGKGWQMEGVRPDTEVPEDQALETALRMARQRPGR
jgi:hypothetical protein